MKISRLLLIVSCIGTMTSPARFAQGGDVNPLFAKALALYRSNDFTTSEALFREGLKRDPGNSLALYYLGSIVERLRPNDPEAIGLFERAYAASPDSTEGVDAFAELSRLKRAQAQRDDQRASADQARADQQAKISRLVPHCFQSAISEYRGKGKVCVCFTVYSKGSTLRSDTIGFNVHHKGYLFDGEHSFDKYTVVGRASDPKIIEQGRLKLSTDLDYGVDPSSWYKNGGFDPPLILRGERVNDNLPPLELDMGDGRLYLGGTAMNGPVQSCNP